MVAPDTMDSTKRALDLGLALAASMILAVPLLLLACLVKLTSRGPALYYAHWSMAT